VCALSGDLPGEHCPHRTKVWFIPGKSPIARCSIHRAALVDPQSGLRVCGPATRVKSEVFEFWPSDLMELYAQAGAPRATPPEFAPECRVASQDGLSPQITSPVKSASLQLFGARRDQRLALSAVADGGVRKLYWFADDAYLGESGPTESFFWNARPGAYILRVVDDHGRADSMELVIAPDGAAQQ
jgi:penicillin-binding protein 1C